MDGRYRQCRLGRDSLERPYDRDSAPTAFDAEGYCGKFKLARVANSWWGWFAINGAISFRTARGEMLGLPSGQEPLPIRPVDDMLLTGRTDDYSQTLLLGLAPADGPLNDLTGIAAPVSADLSEVVDHRALLATLDLVWVLGQPTHRISTRVVSIDGAFEPLPEGIGGNDSSGAPSWSNSAGERAGNDATGGALPSAQAGSPNEADHSEGGAPTSMTGGAGHASETADGGSSTAANEGSDAASEGIPRPHSARPRTSSACGCRVAGATDKEWSAALLVLAAAGLGRWRRHGAGRLAVARP